MTANAHAHAPWQRYWLTALLPLILLALLAATVRPYHGNVSALFHMDQRLHAEYPAPPIFVILDIPAYDGAQYYQIARNTPLLLQPSRWSEFAARSPGAYAYQRILLPVAAYLLAIGQERFLPFSFLAINVICLLLTACCVLLWKKGTPLYALALALSPPALIGLHFSLAEPLTLFLLAAFLLRFVKTEEIHLADLFLLSLLVLSREVTILFVVLTLIHTCWKKRWRSAALLLIPCTIFLAWHAVIFRIFGEVPFLMSAEKKAFPLTAILELLTGEYGYNQYTLSSIALFLAFVLPATLWLIRNLWHRKHVHYVQTAALAFLLLMFTMPDHIWGSITSIGRVITPVYPLFIFAATENDSIITRLLSAAILILGLGIGIALALLPHPFTLSLATTHYSLLTTH